MVTVQLGGNFNGVTSLMHNLNEKYPWCMLASFVPSSNRMKNRDPSRFGIESDIGRNSSIPHRLKYLITYVK